MPWITVFLLIISNVFMTFSWYGHLKYKNLPLTKAIIFIWIIAFLEYCFQVPANRFVYGKLNAAEPKTIQEIITLTIFSVFSILYLKKEFRWNYLVGFFFIVLAGFLLFKK
ncbi:MAG: DMT family protein [Candidatus Aminicenantes bacterium]|nr:DMT family protein [Candidatus Aminicenantes bacterium]